MVGPPTPVPYSEGPSYEYRFCTCRLLLGSAAAIHVYPFFTIDIIAIYVHVLGFYSSVVLMHYVWSYVCFYLGYACMCLIEQISYLVMRRGVV